MAREASDESCMPAQIRSLLSGQKLPPEPARRIARSPWVYPSELQDLDRALASVANRSAAAASVSELDELIAGL